MKSSQTAVKYKNKNYHYLPTSLDYNINTSFQRLARQ